MVFIVMYSAKGLKSSCVCCFTLTFLVFTSFELFSLPLLLCFMRYVVDIYEMYYRCLEVRYTRSLCIVTSVFIFLSGPCYHIFFVAKYTSYTFDLYTRIPAHSNIRYNKDLSRRGKQLTVTIQNNNVVTLSSKHVCTCCVFSNYVNWTVSTTKGKICSRWDKIDLWCLLFIVSRCMLHVSTFTRSS
jgi:hypothetical protein